jgi:hypothetical protein
MLVTMRNQLRVMHPLSLYIYTLEVRYDLTSTVDVGYMFIMAECNILNPELVSRVFAI